MSLLVLGLSHRSAPLEVLERATLDAERTAALRAGLVEAPHVREALVVSTCNRVEVYADVETFHGGLADVHGTLARVSGLDLRALQEHLYVHHEDRAVAHTFTVACGLDSMAIGESQILGQMRSALAAGQHAEQVGPHLNSLFQRALRVGKRAHTETGIDEVSMGLADAGLRFAAGLLGPLDTLDVLVVGAGAMSGVAVATAVRSEVRSVTVVNRTPAKAERLAAAYGAATAPWARLGEALAAADVVVACTGAAGRIVTPALAQEALAARTGRPQVYVDLALPRDVDEAVAGLDGAHVVALGDLGALLAGRDAVPPQVEAVRELVSAETASYLALRRQQHVAPTVTALRKRAAEVVALELERLDSRLPDLGEAERAEVRQTVRRVVDKLLHTPTVRMKQLAGAQASGDYAAALSELFDLDPETVAAVSEAPAEGAPVPDHAPDRAPDQAPDQLAERPSGTPPHPASTGGTTS